MHFRYSEIVDPSTYDAQGLCDGIPLRMHKDPDTEIIGAIRAQRDWVRLVSPVGLYKGGLGARYSFMRVTVPECLPDRLEIISYANEFAFLYDDVMENIDLEKGIESDRQIIDVFGDGVLSLGSEPETRETVVKSKVNGQKKLQPQILAEMVVLDKERALTSMKSWATFIQLSTSRQRSQPFASLEEYLPYRIIDAGEMIWFGTVTFAMALTIPEKEMDLCKQLVRPAFAALSLTNDLFSWNKERDAAKKNGQPHVVNAIWVLMGELSIPESEAKAVCREKIKESVADCLIKVKEAKNNLELGTDLRTYVEAIQYSVSGNLAWSLECPRYHPEASYDSITLSMMEDVVQAAQEASTDQLMPRGAYNGWRNTVPPFLD